MLAGINCFLVSRHIVMEPEQFCQSGSQFANPLCQLTGCIQTVAEFKVEQSEWNGRGVFD